ncbi:MAG TPA: hypothetical protein VNS09_21260 [Solirubrobacter sp.]|nr:hypothetical protein [Solirubrobacter sp.]
MIRALVLTGAPGAGKSAVLEALHGLLDNDGVPHAFLESELLAAGHPWLNEREAYAVLAVTLRELRVRGRDRFLIAATTETGEHLRWLLDAIAADETVVVCVTASPKTAARRVREREPAEWHGRDRLVAAARRLAVKIPALDGIDLRVSTEDRAARDVARELRGRVAWLQP